ncbi:tetratricopeptide repeat protein [Clostridium beijerinckii]|uniref:tetratricopeptide repeat protein n=1 Tax=Clostridium beijerinckii TaxID=1520 RepID=UPI0005A36242|nr:tetratricopeptide repeat protein [Clostridium beijerinckii]
MVNFEMEIKKINPINIKEMELNRYKIDDDIKKSIILYNSAIGEIKKSNFELAINDLKKALSYNKGFSDAIKLIGLCYVSMKRYRNAEKIFKKLKKYAIYDNLANDYIQSLKIKSSRGRNVNNMDVINHINSDIWNEYSKKTKRSTGKIIMVILSTVIIMGGIVMNYFYPKFIQVAIAKVPIETQEFLHKLSINNKLIVKQEEVDNDQNKVDDSLEENMVNLENSEKAKIDSEDQKVKSDSYKNNILGMLDEAEKSIRDGKYEIAAEDLINVKNENLDDDTKAKFDKLWQDLKIRGLWPIYNDGNKLYKQKKYAEALPELKMASQIDSDINIMPWLMYQIGTCYKETNDYSNALIYFRQVKDKYPKTEYASYADYSMKEMGN